MKRERETRDATISYGHGSNAAVKCNECCYRRASKTKCALQVFYAGKLVTAVDMEPIFLMVHFQHSIPLAYILITHS